MQRGVCRGALRGCGEGNLGADVTDSMSELNALLMAKSVLNVGRIITSQQSFQRPIQKPIQERQ